MGNSSNDISDQVAWGLIKGAFWLALISLALYIGYLIFTFFLPPVMWFYLGCILLISYSAISSKKKQALSESSNKSPHQQTEDQERDQKSD